MPSQTKSPRNALAAGVTAYILWGLFPLFWPLLEPAGALEILSHRIVWSFVFMVAALVAMRAPWGWVARVLTPRQLPRLVAASAVIAVNWLVYIWSVNNGYVVEASLGYFINPLVNVVFGVIFFGERLTRGARIGGTLALLGVVVIAFGNLSTLWVSLALALSFGVYGVLKKKNYLPAMEGLVVESAALTPLALAYLTWLGLTGAGTMGASASSSALLVLAGPVTAIPLWLFAIAAPRLPLGVVGMLQYLAPTIQFLIGITIFNQHVTASYWAGLVLVWLGSAIYLERTLRSVNSDTPLRRPTRHQLPRT